MADEHKKDPLQAAQTAMESAFNLAHGLHESLKSYFNQLEQYNKYREILEKLKKQNKT